jgi:oligoendopeptidase F
MTTIESPPPAESDLLASAVAWNLDPLVDGRGSDGVAAMMREAEQIVEQLVEWRGTIGELDASQLAAVMRLLADMNDRLGRAGSFVSLRFSVDTSDPEAGAAMQRFQEQATALSTQVIFLELEWAEVAEDRASRLLREPVLDFCRHYLASARRYRSHLLT